VTVGGLQIAGHCTGSRTDGLPVVILQSGNGATDTQLESIEEHLSERTMVCAYSRPGAGRSDAPAELPRPVGAVVTEMHDVLVALELEPPYFPIGGSAGAVVVFMFAQAYPDEVAGFVFMNGNPPYTSWVADATALTLPQDMVAGAEADYAGDNPERIDFRQNESMVTAPLPPSMPYAVMYDENYSWNPNLRDFSEAEAALFERLAEVGEGGRFIWAKGAGHEIHLSKPQLVADTIDEVWVAATD
jgi:pimeloyl-ACP methyl ester carboxylesterase